MVFKKIAENLRQFINLDSEYYGTIIDKLINFSQKTPIRFPGLQVINLSKEHIDIFSRFPEKLLICEKSDGVRFILIHFANGNILLVGRDLSFYLIELNIDLPKGVSKKKEWEIENMLDGELIVDKSDIIINPDDINFKESNLPRNAVLVNGEVYEVKYLAFDAIVLCEENVGHLKFRKRLQKLTEFLSLLEHQKFYLKAKNKFMNRYDNLIEQSIKNALVLSSQNYQSYNKQKYFNIDIFMKDYYTFDKIEFLYSTLVKKLKHDNDGIILNFDDYPYYSGQSTEIYKWKPANLNTIDFEVTKFKLPNTNNILFLLNVYEGRDKLLPISCLFFHSKEEEEKFKAELEELSMSGKDVITECFYDFNFNNPQTINFYMQIEEGIIDQKLLQNYNPDLFQQNKKNPEKFQKYARGGWKFLRFRKDKTQGNHSSTFFSVWKAIKENVQINDIVKKLEEHKDNKIQIDNNISLATFVKNYSHSGYHSETSKEGFGSVVVNKTKNLCNSTNSKASPITPKQLQSYSAGKDDLLKKKRKVENEVINFSAKEKSKTKTELMSERKENKSQLEQAKKERMVKQANESLSLALNFTTNNNAVQQNPLMVDNMQDDNDSLEDSDSDL